MAAYCQVYGFGHLPTDCSGMGSAPKPYARLKYGITFTIKQKQKKRW